MSAHVKPKGVDKTQKKGINSLSHKNHNYDRKCASFPLLSSNRFSRTLSINDRKRKSSSRLYYFSRWSLRERAAAARERERDKKRFVGWGNSFLIHRAKSTNTKLFFRLEKRLLRKRKRKRKQSRNNNKTHHADAGKSHGRFW